jgi:hypothetical protein
MVLLAFAGSASAVEQDGPPPPNVVGAPEIDPASAISGMTLLLGGLAVIRGRREKK